MDRRKRLVVGQTSTVRLGALGSFSKMVRITIVGDSIKGAENNRRRYSNRLVRGYDGVLLKKDQQPVTRGIK